MTGIDEEATRALEAYAWPGNICELQNIIERACALTEGETVALDDLPEHVLVPAAHAAAASDPAVPGEALSSGAGLSLKDAKDRWMQVLEVSYLHDILERHEGNISVAAKAAGIDRKTFHRLLNKYQIR